jgi:hypothetical protein
MKTITFLTILFLPAFLFATTITGVVKDNAGKPLPYSSILIKGTVKGTTANTKGQYTLQLTAGEYTIVCQHVGYKSIEKKIKVDNTDIELNFELEEQQYNLNDVVVKSGAEDPAYEIIRKTIKKREEHLNEIKKFQTEVYIKGQMQLRNYPKKFMGETVDFEDGDTSKRKIIFLSETVANYSVNGNDKKIEVVSTKVSGSQNGFGFSSPQIISFYENVVNLGTGLNPRGFISPISNNALNYYKYKFMGTFYENGKEISRIKVIPKRKYEPLFTGYINIIENEWRLQNVQLFLLKEQQMQFLDTLTIEQIYVPLKNVWVIKQQVIAPAGNFFSFDFFGSFVQVYDKFNIEPEFKKKFFDNTILKFFDSSNKKTLSYWDSVRPIPLLEAEKKDYKKKDSLEQVRQSPHYLDSLDKRRNKLTGGKLILTGMDFGHEKNKSSLAFDPLIRALGIYKNSVEGTVSKYSISYNKRFEGRQSLLVKTNLRYGYTNTHFNADVSARYIYGKKYINTISIDGGKRVYQFNNNNPIDEFNNTLSTYWWQHNYMKTYEAWMGRINYSKGVGNGMTVNAGIEYQDRMPLENYSDSIKGTYMKPNYPTEISSSNIPRHQAATVTIGISWRPGSKYVEFPDRKVNIGSKYPTFNLSLTQGINNFLGSDVDYTKWKLIISDNLNLKLMGRLNYRFDVGGFLNANKTFTPDYNHYLGNQTAIASEYMNSFQIMPYYQFSNTENFYTTAHAEYHLDGLLTNKIPGFRKLNWFLVVGANALYINSNSNYVEGFISLENLFKIGRVDFVHSFHQPSGSQNAIRFSFPLLFNGRGSMD